MKRKKTMAPIYAIAILIMMMCLNIPGAMNKIASLKAKPIIVSAYNLVTNYDDTLISLLEFYAETTNITKVNILGTNSDINAFLLRGPQTLSADAIYKVLSDKQSPAANMNDIQQGLKAAEAHNIDFAYVLAMFFVESNYATADAYTYAINLHNPGNIMQWDAAGNRSIKQFNTWGDGFEAHIKLLADYRDVNDKKTIREAIYRWAPPNENETSVYADTVEEMVKSWRQINKKGIVITSNQSDIRIDTIISKVNPPNTTLESVPLALNGCLGTNVRDAYALSATLQNVTIRPNSDWSFNENWKIGDLNTHICGVVYGGICDMAARYVNIARKLGITVKIARHTDNKGNYIKLDNVDYEDSVGIWSDGTRDGGDALIINNTSKTVRLKAIIEDNTFKVIGWLE